MCAATAYLKEVDLHEEKVLITCAVVFGVILAVYLGFAFYFSSHYLFNTKINSVKYAGKTAKEAIEKYSPKPRLPAHNH